VRTTLLLSLLALLTAGCPPTAEPEDPDPDGDGYLDEVDCDPDDGAIHPGADDPYGDGIDSDCDGFDGIDTDGDGYPSNVPASDPLHDCNDSDPAVYPGAEEVPGDGIDNDCDGQDCLDADGDGHCAGVTDCDDADPTAWLGAPELVDGVDNDCDGQADEGTAAFDDDGDGFCEGADVDGDGQPDCSDGAIPGDCDDSDPALSVVDVDGDGFSTCEADCDDGDPAVHPAAAELCDGLDTDCDGTIPADEADHDADGDPVCSDCDDDDPSIDYLDLDGDGYSSCEMDCDDSAPTIYPGAADPVLDGLDQNCDGTDGVDADGDGWPWGGGPGFDCDDADPWISPGEVEICDGVDNDCDGTADGDPVTGDGAACPATGCLGALTARPSATDGLYWVEPDATPAFQAWCDMAGGGWTLVYRSTNVGGLAEHGEVADGQAIGATPFTPSSIGQFKLEDDDINALRSGTPPNDLKVVVTLGGSPLGTSWHPSACVLQSGQWLDASHVCNSSTTVGPDSASYTQSGHTGSLSRWYTDAAFGFIWPNTHIGPAPGGWDHSGDLPNPYCTWYDYRVCPTDSTFEIWAL
jgi:hypothetical protein